MLAPQQVLDRYFPEVRAWLIQIAAVMDRYDRAAEEHGSRGDDRLELYRQALDVLRSPEAGADRAARIQMIFSDPYEGSGEGARDPRGERAASERGSRA